MNANLARLAAQVVPAAHLAAFLALDLRAQLVGLATFAHLAGDGEATEAALTALRAL